MEPRTWNSGVAAVCLFLTMFTQFIYNICPMPTCDTSRGLAGAKPAACRGISRLGSLPVAEMAAVPYFCETHISRTPYMSAPPSQIIELKRNPRAEC